MSPKLPSLKPKDVLRILEKAGFVFIRQKGSHRLYLKEDCAVVVPIHNKDLKTGTLRNIIKQSKLPIEMFLKS